ncbi:MAG TPA: NAD-dependent epimerase/dehydratase family protein, partial [Pseudomonadales bacterium]|nr:NAD-dependent epimerase/dehydratase family protein [Pseudomonadales bacterium]
MNIFVTGGSGFVGQHLIRYLVKSGHKVWALARSKDAESKVKQAGATPVQGSLENIPRWAGALAQCEVVIHAASTVLHWGPWSFFENQMVTPTEELLAAAEQQSVRRFIFISSESALNDGNDMLD